MNENVGRPAPRVSDRSRGRSRRAAPPRASPARRAQRDDVFVAVCADRRSPSGSTRTGRGGCIAVARLGFLGFVDRSERRMTACRRLPVGVVAHVLHVGLPAPCPPRTAACRCSGYRRGIHAAGPRSRRRPEHQSRRRSREHLAVGLVLHVRRLAGDERDVVVVALVSRRVVVLEQRPLRRERLREIRVRGGFAERRSRSPRSRARSRTRGAPAAAV